MNTKTSLANYSTGSFDTGASPIKRVVWYYVNIIFFISPLNPISSLKVLLLRIFGAKIGKGVVIKPAVNIKYPWKLVIGNYCWIGEHVWIDNLDHVMISDNCCISQGAMLLCGNHNFKKSTFDLITLPITLEEGAWVGAYSIVCPGVCCKSHSVLAVNSVATRDLDAYSIHQGNPAVKVKDRIIS
jgi:putative colanic acid biosynthesis acetyltransferase WcaF